MPRAYSDRTLKLLWGRSGGRCANPNCRVELLVDATEYDPIVVIGEIAHIAAASDRGPRAEAALAVSARNDYENLILLCQNCHAQIDGQPDSYSIDRIKEIKVAHEAWVRSSLPERGNSRIGWTVLCLASEHPVDVSTVNEALGPDFGAGEAQLLQVPLDPADWGAVDAATAGRVQALLAAGDPFDCRLAVFPLAPVSACLSLGYYLTNRPHVRLFQYHRDDHTWAWPRRAAPAQDIEVSGLENGDSNCRTLGFLFHYSAVITDSAIASLSLGLNRRIDFRVPTPSTSWLQHPDQVKWAASEARQAFEQAVHLFPQAECWHLFFAGPAPVAVAVGQQLNPTMCPRAQLYEYRHRENPPYRASIQLGMRVNSHDR